MARLALALEAGASLAALQVRSMTRKTKLVPMRTMMKTVLMMKQMMMLLLLMMMQVQANWEGLGVSPDDRVAHHAMPLQLAVRSPLLQLHPSEGEEQTTVPEPLASRRYSPS